MLHCAVIVAKCYYFGLSNARQFSLSREDFLYLTRLYYLTYFEFTIYRFTVVPTGLVLIVRFILGFISIWLKHLVSLNHSCKPDVFLHFYSHKSRNVCVPMAQYIFKTYLQLRAPLERWLRKS
jgi:hypothetical protein